MIIKSVYYKVEVAQNDGQTRHLRMTGVSIFGLLILYKFQEEIHNQNIMIRQSLPKDVKVTIDNERLDAASKYPGCFKVECKCGYAYIGINKSSFPIKCGKCGKDLPTS